MATSVSLSTVAKTIRSISKIHTPDYLILLRSICAFNLPSYDKLIACTIRSSGGSVLPDIVKGLLNIIIFNKIINK